MIILLIVCFANMLSCSPHRQLFSPADIQIPKPWFNERINEDLSVFAEKKLSLQDIEKTWQKVQKKPYFVKISLPEVIVSKDNGKDKRINTIKAALKLIKKLHLPLPKIDLIINMGDGFIGESKKAGFTAPVFAFSRRKDIDKGVLLIPDPDNLSCIKNLATLMPLLNETHPWDAKIHQLIWRGAMTGGYYTQQNYQRFPRARLVAMSLQYPNLIDARFSGFSQAEKQLYPLFQEWGYFGKYLSINDQLAYRYQFLADGNTTSWHRATWQLYSNSLIFKHDSGHIQWYYHLLKPKIHYVPVADDMHDLVDAIIWAESHEPEALKIINNANALARTVLTRESMILYLYHAIRAYARLFDS